MNNLSVKKHKKRVARALRVRKKLRGQPGRPRLCIHKSNAHLGAQIIDDIEGKTVCSISSKAKEVRGTDLGRKNKKSAHELGLKLAELAKSADVTKVVLDRGHSKYHGVIAAFADGLKAGGIEL